MPPQRADRPETAPLRGLTGSSAPERSRPSRQTFPTGLPQQPFQPVQRQAQQRVQRTQRALPKEPTPYIPRLPNPTRAQAQAALTLARNHERLVLGPNASVQRIAAHHQELLTDPRHRPYVETLEHYARALNPPITGPRYLAQAKPLAPPSDVSLPLLGEAQIKVPFSGKLLQALNRLGPKIAPGLAAAGAETGFMRNIGHDILSVGEFPFVGGYKALESAVQGSQGNFQPAAKFAGQLAEGLKHGAVGEAVQGHLGGSLKAFKEAPLISALEVAAPLSAAGRAGGAAARGLGSTPGTGGLRGALARTGTQIRPPVALTNDAGAAAQGLVRQRRYSPDLTRKAAQVAADRGRETVKDAQGKTVYRTELGHRVPVLAPKAEPKLARPSEEEAFQQKRMNFEGSRTQAGEYAAQKQAGKAIAAIEKPGRTPIPAVRGSTAQDLTHLVATGRIRTAESFNADLQKELANTEAALKAHEANPSAGIFRTKQDLQTARDNAAMLRKATTDKRLQRQIPAIVKAGHGIAEELNRADAEQIRLGIRPADEIERAKLSEYAIAHMEAQHFTTEAHGAAERTALAKEKAAFTRADELVPHPNSPQVKEETAAKAELEQAVKGREGLTATHVARKEHEGRTGSTMGEQDRLSAATQRVSQASERLKRAEAATARRAAYAQTARAEAHRLRSERWEVSGRRRPEDQAAHEQAIEELTNRRRAVVSAKEDVRKAELARKAVVVRKGAQGYDAQAADARLLGRKEALRAAEAEHQLARQHGSKRPAAEAALRTKEGKQLTDRAIREDAEKAGRNPDTLAYVPQVTSVGRKGAFHKPFRAGARPSNTGPSRTGALQKRGAAAISKDLLHQEAVNKATTINIARHYDQFVKEVGLKRPDGRYFNGKEGLDLASRLREEGRPQLVPMRAFSAAAPRATKAIASELQSSTAMETAHLDMLRSGIVGEGDKSSAPNVVMVPRHLVEQQQRLLAPSSEFDKAAQMMVGPFRRAVLPQPRWLAGNFIEPYVVRLPLSGAGINVPGLLLDARAAHAIIKSLARQKVPGADQALADIQNQQIQSGLFVGKQRASSTHRTYEDFSGRTRQFLIGAHIIRNLPAVKQLTDLAVTLTNFFFNVNKAIETSVQYQALGKSARQDVQALTGSWSQTVLLGRKAIDEVARGLIDTPTQHRFMEAQWEMLGKYDSWNPAMKRLVRTYAPFLPWTLASIRFVYWTMPAHHTVAFTGLLKAGQSVMKEWEEEHAEVKAAGIEGTLADAEKTARGHYRDWARYTPFGISIPMSHGELGQIPSNLVPQIQGAQEALAGRDSFGRELQVPKTPENPKGKASAGQRGGIALASLIESMIYGPSTGKRLLEGGGTPYSNSNFVNELLRNLKGEPPLAKPESSHETALNRTFNPFRTTMLKERGTGGATTPADLARERRADERSEEHHDQTVEAERERRADARAR